MNRLQILAIGDLHGYEDVLQDVVEQTAGEVFDFIILTGDLTSTWMSGIGEGVRQLRSLEPYLEALANRGTVVYTHGFHDRERAFSDGGKRVTDAYDLDVGYHLCSSDPLYLDGQRFAADPSDTDPSTILITHRPDPNAFYRSTNRAYFSGYTHRARKFRTSLNTGYLRTKGKSRGAYFIVEIKPRRMVVTQRGIEEPWSGFVCEDHSWFGRQFKPETFGCEVCVFGGRQYYGEIAYLAYTEIVPSLDTGESVWIGDLVTAAREIIYDDAQFAKQFEDYLESLGDSDRLYPVDPLKPAATPGRYTARGVR